MRARIALQKHFVQNNPTRRPLFRESFGSARVLAPLLIKQL